MSAPPTLEPRFQEPPGWRWHNLNRGNRTIRFGTASPPDTIPDGIIVCLHGVREFSEKYFETARWALDRNLAFWTFDWAGQGKSTRFLKNPQKRHSTGFQDDLDDLHYFIMEYIKHASVHPDKGRIPLIMLAHSMGANLGLRYLHDHPDMFACAGFTAPMLGINVFAHMPQSIAKIATGTMALLMGKSYIAGGHDWKNEETPESRKLSSDPIRSKLHNQWGISDPDLVTGAITYKWLNEAQKSCMIVQNPTFAATIKTPCLFALPAHEHLVDNTMSHSIIANIKGEKTLEFPNAYHEILMEQDTIRNTFLDAFYQLAKENVIDKPQALKPF